MIPINRTYAPVQAIVDELERCGMRHAVTSPGSRNAPIALTLAASERIESISVLDERSAGFMALGMAKATGLPVAVTCTSGTAVANLLPAVVEAYEARVPLILLTADRPPELRGVGAGQAIDQLKIFGSAAKWFVELGNGEPCRDWATHVRALACRAWATAAGGRPGPVHVNLPLRDPLAPVREELDPEAWAGRADGTPWVTVHDAPRLPSPADAAGCADRLTAAKRGVVVCGSFEQELGSAAGLLASRAGWPVLADPLSGARCGHGEIGNVVAHYDALLRAEAFAADHSPDLVVRMGDMPTSKPLRSWLAGAPQIVFDPHGAWQEPTRNAETILTAHPAFSSPLLVQALDGHTMATEDGWLDAWVAADRLAAGVLADGTDLTEPRAYTAIEPILPEGALVWVSSSMAIRDVESFFPKGERRIHFLSNRGANGIDGVVSAAAGAALAGDAPTWLLIGELALAHDVGGLLAATRAGADLRIVCMNNGGGGIFDFLPVAEHAAADAYEGHVTTPAGTDLEALAALAGIEHRLATTVEEIRAAAAEPGLVEVRTDRRANVDHHRELFASVAAAIA